MKLSILLKTILLGMLLITSLNAQETEDLPTCNDTYDICATKCESLENGYEQCIMKCDIEYETCSELEENNQKDSD